MNAKTKRQLSVQAEGIVFIGGMLVRLSLNDVAPIYLIDPTIFHLRLVKSYRYECGSTETSPDCYLAICPGVSCCYYCFSQFPQKFTADSFWAFAPVVGWLQVLPLKALRPGPAAALVVASWVTCCYAYATGERVEVLKGWCQILRGKT